MCHTKSYCALLLTALLLLSYPVMVPAQQPSTTDSLEKELNNQTGEKKLDLLVALFWQFNGTEKEKADSYAMQAMQLATTLKTDRAIAKASFVNGVAQETAGDFTKAGEHFNTYLEKAKSAGDTSLIAGALNSLGILHHKRSRYQEALSYFMDRLQYLKPDEYGALATNFNNIGMIHEAIDKNPKALEFFGKAIELHRKIDNRQLIGGTLSNMGVIYFKLKEYDKALQHYIESIDIMKQLGDKGILSILYENRGNVYKEQGKFQLAINNYNESLVFSKELADAYGIASVNGNLGEAYAYLHQYPAAIDYLNRSRLQSEQIGASSLTMNADRILAKTYAGMKNYTKAYEHQQAYQILRDSIFNENKNKQIQELQTRYETERKNNEIEILNADNQLKAASLQKEKLIRNISIAGLLLIVATAWVIVRNIRQKSRIARELAAKNEELSRQQIMQLEKDKKIELMDAMMTAEEKERTRVARDLHDGISGLLAATRMQFEGSRHEAGLASLDKASTEVRRIAHNMIPELLMRFGLAEALADFLNGIQTAHGINIHFEQSGLDIPFDRKNELTIYRIIQELINNTIKHAQASEILVQMIGNQELLSITIEDNGTGFDAGNLTSKSGIGISNILSRVQYLGGEIKFQSTKDSGSSVYIQLPVEQLISTQV